MMVLYNECKKCNYACNTIHFQQNFENWTSGDDDINKFIQDTQLLVHRINNKIFEQVLEWIPYDRFYNIKCITEKKVYNANWIDGRINCWDDKKQNWERENHNMIVTLKRLNNSKNIALEFMNEV
jgi:hypothetical protein